VGEHQLHQTQLLVGGLEANPRDHNREVYSLRLTPSGRRCDDRRIRDRGGDDREAMKRGR
jgi:hypothetical protein